MAAKLKKRALAEYQSQVEVDDEDKKKSSKKLKLLMPPRRTDSTSSSVTSLQRRRLSSCDSVSLTDSLLHQAILLSPTILDGSLPVSEVQDLIKKLNHSLHSKLKFTKLAIKCN